MSSAPFTVLIPARLSSSRLPGKPLADIAGLPMVVRVAQRASRSGAARCVVAADDDVALCKSAEQAAVTARRDAETMRDTLRAALEEALSETGCPAVVSGHHIAELREGRPSVVVTDPDALPD